MVSCVPQDTGRWLAFLVVLMLLGQAVQAQRESPSIWRFAPPPLAAPRFADLDRDGDPDLLFSALPDSTPVCWIDDDDDMRPTDLQGDTDSDCLLIDRNRDGQWNGPHDLAIDWVDENQDGKPDVQVLVENGKEGVKGWESGHFMIMMDTDRDGVFHHFDWESLTLEAWAHEGRSRFYQDYSGQSAFLKSMPRQHKSLTSGSIGKTLSCLKTPTATAFPKWPSD